MPGGFTTTEDLTLIHSSKTLMHAVALTSLVAMPAFAQQQLEPAILVVGASYEQGGGPFNDALQAPLGGIAVNAGSYLSLGNALARSRALDGFIINEAQGGATTFDRLACNPGPDCGPAAWQGLDTQLTKAIARVTLRNPANPAQILGYNADYVVIGGMNDCLHADAFGVPTTQTQKCSVAELEAVADRLIAAGSRALSLGIKPVYYAMPAYDRMDLPLAASLFGLPWMLSSEVEYSQWRDTIWNHLKAGLPGALFVADAWNGFSHIGDGLHPSPSSAEKAAQRIAVAILIDRAKKRQ